MPYRATKRLLDIVVSVPVLIIVSPLMAAIAIAIVTDSRGGPLFLQQRVGLRGEPFTMVKFRTMAVDNDDSPHQGAMAEYVKGELQTRKNERGEDVYLYTDDRITRVGGFLRKTSLDELPNLWNVLTGSMSLVGPRPPIPYEVKLYDEDSLRRLQAKPGMTGLSQVRGRGVLSFEEIVAWDVEYINNQSLGLDLSILVQTIPAVLSRRGT